MGLLYNIPNNFERKSQITYPGYLEGLDHFYYFNSKDQLTDGSFSNWKLALVDQYGTVLNSDLATLTKDGTSPYRFYFTFNIQSGLATNRLCRFVIYNSADSNKLKYVFDWFLVLDATEAENWVYLQYRNSYDIHNYNYGHSEYSTKYNNIFLKLNLIDIQPEDEITPYTKAADGKTNILKSQGREVFKLEPYFFSKGLNDLMKILPHHDDVLVNGLPVISKAGYAKEENRFNSGHKGLWEVYNEEYSSVNVN